jgi:hypothetical protein
MTSKTEEWLYKKAKEVDSELELQDLYTSKFSFGGRWVMDLLEEYHKEQLTLTDVVDCKHDNEIMRQGDGFVYSTCGDCGDEL